MFLRLKFLNDALITS